jgi:hypothetical protein
MSNGYSKQSIEELREKLEEARATSDAEKIAPILISKSLLYLSSEIAVLKEAMAETINQLDKRIQKVIASNNRLTWAQWAYAIAMFIVSAVIAFSALVQAGIIKL